MSTTIRIKRSDVSGNPSVLATGELAYSNLPDNGANGGDRLYIGMGTETGGNAAQHIVIGGKYFVDIINAATANNTANTLVKRDASGNFSAGTITADVTGNASTASKLQTPRTISLTGGVTGSGNFDGSANLSISTTIGTVTLGTQTAGNYVATIDGTANEISVTGSGAASAAVTISLADLGVSPAGTYGGGGSVPVLTVDAKGRVTSVSTTPVQTAFSIVGGSGSSTINNGDTFNITGGTGISTTVGSKSVTITNTGVVSLTGTANQVTVSNPNGSVTLSLPQNIHAGAAPTFAGLTLTGDLSMGSNRITGLADPVNPSDAATKNYVDSARAGLDVKDSVRAATTGNIVLSGLQTIDTVSLNDGDRVLAKDQTNAAQNGIYIVHTGAWVRAADADSSAKVTSGMFTFVEEGSININQSFVLITNGAITLDVTNLTFTQFASAGSLSVGDGLVKSGNTISVGAGDGITVAPGLVSLASSVAGNGLLYTSGVLSIKGTANRISVSATGVDIDSNYAGQSSINTVGAVTTGTWNGTIISGQFGGTGVNNAGKTITLGGNLTTVGAYALQLTLTGATSLTLPTSGTLVNTAVTALSNLAQVGTITSGTWQANAVGAAYGGTGQTTYNVGDVLVATGATTLSRLALGAAGKVLQSDGTNLVYGDIDGGTY